MQIKTKMRYHLTPIRMVIINNSTNNTCWQGCGERNPFTLLVGMQTCTATVESSMEMPAFQKIKNGQTQDGRKVSGNYTNLHQGPNWNYN